MSEKFYTPVRDLKRHVDELRSHFRTGATLPLDYRVKQLENLMRMCDECEGAILDAVHKDLRKNPWEARLTELGVTKKEIAYVLNRLEEWMQPEYMDTNIVFKLDQPHVRSDPLGVVCVMSAWNYPVSLALIPMIGAIAAGNAVVLKPSEVSPAVAKCLGEIIPKYCDNNLVRVVNGGVEETTELLKYKFDKICYTGNGVVGSIVMKAAAVHLTPVLLELGGKSPCIVADDANVQTAARRITWGKFMNCGQTCIAPDYVLCTKEMEAKLVPEMQKCITDMFGADVQKSPDYGRIVNGRHFNRIKGLLSSSGGKVAIGGNMDEQDLFISPTVLTGISADKAVLKEEIFGPLLPIVTVKKAADAISYINDRDKPLALYLFTHDQTLVNDVFTKTSSGGVTVNDTVMHQVCDELPFGGCGPSGMGAYHGKFSFDTFSHKKANLHRSSGLEFLNDMRYAPYGSGGKIKFLNSLVTEPRQGPVRKLFWKLVSNLGYIAVGAALLYLYQNRKV